MLRYKIILFRIGGDAGEKIKARIFTEGNAFETSVTRKGNGNDTSNLARHIYGHLPKGVTAYELTLTTTTTNPPESPISRKNMKKIASQLEKMTKVNRVAIV